MASVPDTFGRSRVSYGREECVALSSASGTEIDSGRKDDEDDLCKIKFDDPNVIFCPALHSTNPGTDIYELPTGVSRASFEQKECAKETKRNADFEAKGSRFQSCTSLSCIFNLGHGYERLRDKESNSAFAEDTRANDGRSRCR